MAKESVVRRWGADIAVLDDEVARRRLLDAASRCIIRRGDAQIRMTEVADEAAVARSTLYRYFATRGDLILGLLLSRIDAALDAVVAGLAHADDARTSLPELILEPVGLVEGNPLNEALFSAESSALVTWLELNSESLVDAGLRHFGSLLQRWRDAGQIHGDLDLRETVRWLNAVSLVMLSDPWRHRSRAEKHQFLDVYLVRALVVGDIGPAGS